MLTPQVCEWIKQPYWQEAADGTRFRAGDALMSYVAPGSEPSVVMGRHLDSYGMPKAMPKSVVSPPPSPAFRRA